MPRLWATAATPAVRQLARPERTSSTGVGALSSAAKTCGWSASIMNVLLRDCSAPSPKKLPIAERLCVPFSHSQLARHLNWAASGVFSSASRAPRSAVTLTPLFTLVMVEMLMVIVSRSYVESAGTLKRTCHLHGPAIDKAVSLWRPLNGVSFCTVAALDRK